MLAMKKVAVVRQSVGVTLPGVLTLTCSNKEFAGSVEVVMVMVPTCSYYQGTGFSISGIASDGRLYVQALF